MAKAYASLFILEWCVFRLRRFRLTTRRGCEIAPFVGKSYDHFAIPKLRRSQVTDFAALTATGTFHADQTAWDDAPKYQSAASTRVPLAYHTGAKPMNTSRKHRIARLLALACTAGCALTAVPHAGAALMLTPAGVADGFSLSVFYSDPGPTYGLLGAVNAPGNTVIGSGFARGQLYLF